MTEDENPIFRTEALNLGARFGIDGDDDTEYFKQGKQAELGPNQLHRARKGSGSSAWLTKTCVDSRAGSLASLRIVSSHKQIKVTSSLAKENLKISISSRPPEESVHARRSAKQDEKERKAERPQALSLKVKDLNFKQKADTNCCPSPVKNTDLMGDLNQK